MRPSTALVERGREDLPMTAERESIVPTDEERAEARAELVAIFGRTDGLTMSLPTHARAVESIYGRFIEALLDSDWEQPENTSLRERMATILNRTAAALHGDTGNIHPSWHDLDEVAAQVTAAKERAEAQVERVRALIPNPERIRDEHRAIEDRGGDCGCAYKDCYECGKWHSCTHGYLGLAADMLAALAETTDAPQEGLSVPSDAAGADLRASGAKSGNLGDGRSAGRCEAPKVIAPHFTGGITPEERLNHDLGGGA